MAGHRRLNADARRGQRQGQVVRQRGNLADAHTRASVARLDEERLHAELRDRRSAADLHHLRRRSKGGQCLFDQMRTLLDEILVHGRRVARVEDLLDFRK